MIERYNIQCISEEMSVYALKKWRVPDDSFPCRVAKDISKPHRYCNPDTKMLDTQREQYWINELIVFNTFPLLFILGACHVESFFSLLVRFEFQPFIVERNWQPNTPE